MSPVSWILLITSPIIAFLGFRTLLKNGKPKGQIENTTYLVVSGMYKFIRHPIYSSIIPGVIGILLKGFGYIQILLTVIIYISVVLTAKIEEKEMIKKFGSVYQDYMKRTKMFIPYIF